MLDERSGPLLSVVIPVLHDTPALCQTLGSLTRQVDVRFGEVIVASGAPIDRELAGVQAAFPLVRWVVAPSGRGAQMNAGAAVARGEWLVFLHADTRLADDWAKTVRDATAQTGLVAGCFQFALASSSFAARVIEWGVGWRVRLFGLPYGDQVFVVRRSVFDALGGYAVVPLMEDVELVRRLRAHGHSMQILPSVAVTSARRWEQDGWIRRSGMNLLLITLYLLGVSPERLASWYHRKGIDSMRAVRTRPATR